MTLLNIQNGVRGREEGTSGWGRRRHERWRTTTTDRMSIAFEVCGDLLFLLFFLFFFLFVFLIVRIGIVVLCVRVVLLLVV